MEDELVKAYNDAAENFLLTRTKSTETTGFQNRDVEQPTMFKLISNYLRGKKLLDIGCGPGIHLNEYIKRGAEGFGIDASKEMIRLAKKHCPEGKFFVQNIPDLKFKNNYFDIVTASFVLDHIKDLDKCVKEVNRILDKNGIFIFSVPHPIINMFRDSEKGKFIPSHSYYDNQPFYCNIAKTGKKFIDYARQLQEYFEIPLRNNFILLDFQENQPDKSWQERYANFNSNYLKAPFLCFFKWKKNNPR